MFYQYLSGWFHWHNSSPESMMTFFQIWLFQTKFYDLLDRHGNSFHGPLILAWTRYWTNFQVASYLWWLNSFRPTDTYMHHQPSPSVVQAFCLFGTKPLSEPMLYDSQLDLRDKLQWNCIQNLNIFIKVNVFENVIWKMVAILSWSQWVNGHVMSLMVIYKLKNYY